MAQELVDKIRAAAQARGIDPELALSIARAESSLDPRAKARTSSASGLFQVTKDTWKEYGGKPGKQMDPDENIRVGLDIIAKNTNLLKTALNRDPRPAEVYAAHYFGPTGARSFLTADPATPIAKVLGEKAVKANPNLQGKTAGQVLAQLEGEVGGAPATAAVSRETSPAPTRTPAEEIVEPALKSGMTAQAPAPAAGKLAALGPGYQAALALSFLADEDEKEGRDPDTGPSVAEEWLKQTQSRPAALALSDISIKSPFAALEPQPTQPQMLAEGGEVGEMQEGARKGEAYKALERYLQARGEMPSVKVSKYLPEGMDALFSSDNLNIGSGSVEISGRTPKEVRPSLLAHEMTHAADRQMKQQAIEQGMFGKSNQFTEAYEKMVGQEGRNRSKIARRMYPEWAEENEYYRSSPEELAAHGTGAFAGPTLQRRGPRHVDATAATELQILLDLAQRNVDKGPTGLSKIPAFFRKMGRYADGGEVEPTPEELAAASRPATVNPMIRRQGEAARRLAAMRDVNTLPDPRTYAAVTGFLGTAPDEQGFSALHPDIEGLRKAGEAGFYAGTAAQVAPMAAGVKKAFPALADVLGLGKKSTSSARSAREMLEEVPTAVAEPTVSRETPELFLGKPGPRDELEQKYKPLAKPRPEITGSPEFQERFKGSKVVDYRGEPLIMYRSTPSDEMVFQSQAARARAKGEYPMSGTNEGIYFTHLPELSAAYGKTMYPVYLDIKNPFVIPKNAPFTVAHVAQPTTKNSATSMFVTPEHLEWYRKHGYDGIINLASNEVVVFSPSQAISAISPKAPMNKAHGGFVSY